METIGIIGALTVIGFLLFIFVYVGEQKEEEDWLCYRRKAYRNEASNGYCQGEEGNVRCGHCLYYKQWKRRNIYK